MITTPAKALIFSLFLLVLQGCANVYTFPTTARAGDTISLLVGGTEDARKDTVSVTLTDSSSTVFDLQALGKIRTLFNIKPDSLSEGLYYSNSLELGIPWAFGHEPKQSVVVLDLPTTVAAGVATLTINTNVTDNSSGAPLTFTQQIEILPGTGSTDTFIYKDPFQGDTATDLTRLEPLPYAKLTFGTTKAETIAAASVVIDFNELNVDPNDIAVYSPKTTLRDTNTSFDARQHNMYWHQDGNLLYIDIISPNGITALYLNTYIMHPRNIAGTPDFTIVSAKTYDINGNETGIPAQLVYTP